MKKNGPNQRQVEAIITTGGDTINRARVAARFFYEEMFFEVNNIVIVQHFDL